jgi:predicted DNA-binding transcriptional regulator YafY
MKQLITEQQKSSVISNAIRNKQTAKISYNSENSSGRGMRIIEPAELGYNAKGELLVRAWQVSGASFSRSVMKAPIPGWRSFKLDRITGWRNTGEEYQDIRPIDDTPAEEDTIVQTIEKTDTTD